MSAHLVPGPFRAPLLSTGLRPPLPWAPEACMAQPHPPELTSATRASAAPGSKDLPMATSSSVLHTHLSVCQRHQPPELSRAWACVRSPRTDGQRDVRGSRPPFSTLFSRVTVHYKLLTSQPKALGLTAAEEEGLAGKSHSTR